MAVQAKTLEGLTNAEFGKAAKLLKQSSWAQLALAAISAVAVFLSGTTPTLLFAVGGAILFAAWTIADWHYRACRRQAERGRKALLIAEGLAGAISPGEMRDIEAGFTVSRVQGEAAHNPQFFASEKDKGRSRLLELIEESAFYSCRLYGLSASATWRKLVIYGFLSLSLFISTVYFIDAETVAFAAKILLVILVFLMSQEVLGNARDYSHAHLVLSSMQARIRAIRAAGYPEGDLLLLMGNYNSAVEGAPMMVPGIYEKHARRLDELWRKHLLEAA